MGFCLFNNVAVTAAELVESGGRVAIVDWDVHHGNGTQHAFSADPRVLYVSMHQHPFYPGTGWLDEIGEGDAAGTTVNLPMPRGSGGGTYAEALTRVVLPVVEQFEAEWLLVSAGYDAHRLDPLAELDLVEADYALMASALAPLFPDHRAIYFLEGGYDLGAMRDSVTATLNGHAGLGIESKTAPEEADPAGPFIDQIVETLSPYWDLG